MNAHNNENLLSGIRNIIFDLGGVVLNIDYARTIQAFKNIGFTNFDEVFSKVKQTKIFDAYDKGLIDSHTFRTELCKAAEMNIPPKDFDACWNAMLLNLPYERIETLRLLKAKYNIYLLSNTNEIHLEYFFNYMQQAHNISDFGQLFHKAYYSCRVQMRKPDAEIYRKVMDDNALLPAETIFFDDLLPNLETAQTLGIKTFQVLPHQPINELFR